MIILLNSTKAKILDICRFKMQKKEWVNRLPLMKIILKTQNPRRDLIFKYQGIFE
jgi:hypothetical protein